MQTTLPAHAAVVLLTAFAIAAPAAAQSAASQAASQPALVDVPLDDADRRFRLLGRLGKPLGQIVTVQGVVIEGQFKGYEGGPNLCVQRIDGVATQKFIRLPISPLFGREFGSDERNPNKALPEVIAGKTYEFEGYETGGYIGIPFEVLERTGNSVQTANHYFRLEFLAFRGKAIPAASASPADFVDRVALIEGKAVSQQSTAWITGANWTLLIDAKAAWPAHSEGKRVEALGTIRTGDATDHFRLENGVTRLARLEDQVGQPVCLRGTACSFNGEWWFNYRGVKIQVENMSKLPDWSTDLHYRPVEISGILERIDPFSKESDRERTDDYIIRKPTWKRIDALLSPEQANGR